MPDEDRRLGHVPGGWIVGCFAFRPKNLCALWILNNPLPFKDVIPTQVGIHLMWSARERVCVSAVPNKNLASSLRSVPPFRRQILRARTKFLSLIRQAPHRHFAFAHGDITPSGHMPKATAYPTPYGVWATVRIYGTIRRQLLPFCATYSRNCLSIWEISLGSISLGKWLCRRCIVATK